MSIDLAVLEQRSPAERAALEAKRADLILLQQGPGWSAVRKPAGLPSLGAFFGDHLHFAAMACALVQGDAALPDCGLVHRLDNGTSGVSLLAHDALTLAALLQQRTAHLLSRDYWAIVQGALPDQGEISEPITHHPSNSAKMIISPAGQTARTLFRTLKRSGSRCLLELQIWGGRRHQIRVHLASLGAPILGDPVYGLAGPRLALHAVRVHFDDPVVATGHAAPQRLTPERFAIAAEPGEHFWAFAPELR